MFTVPNFPVGTTELNLSADFQILTVRLLGVLPLDFVHLAGLGYTDRHLDFELTDGVNSVSPPTKARNEPGYYFGVFYDWDRVAKDRLREVRLRRRRRRNRDDAELLLGAQPHEARC